MMKCNYIISYKMIKNKKKLFVLTAVIEDAILKSHHCTLSSSSFALDFPHFSFAITFSPPRIPENKLVPGSFMNMVKYVKKRLQGKRSICYSFKKITLKTFQTCIFISSRKLIKQRFIYHIHHRVPLPQKAQYIRFFQKQISEKADTEELRDRVFKFYLSIEKQTRIFLLKYLQRVGVLLV